MEITQEALKEFLWYDKETGDFYWRKVCTPKMKSWDKAGTINSRGYVRIKIFQKIHQAHRLAWLYVYGNLPKQLDHINCNKNDNRIENLRPATHSTNGMNRGVQANNKLGFKGVIFHKRDKKFIANIRVLGKQKCLGYFNTAEEAHSAYIKASGELHGQFSRI
jgi:hypothetical protein